MVLAQKCDKSVKKVLYLRLIKKKFLSLQT